VYIYAVLLAIGFFGIVGMTLAGFMHIGPHAHSGGHAGHGAHGHLGHAPWGHGHAASAHGGHAQGHAGPRFDIRSLFSLSPLDIFSYCAGAGVAAFLARPYLAKAYLPICAILGALLFDLCFTRAIASFIGKFGAPPSGGLEGSIATPGEAVTNFDSQGKGLIRLTLDGQVVQLLATLEEHERASGVQVRRGDSLLVVEVDSARNRCLVTRELPLSTM
jgi:hypothetical protein